MTASGTRTLELNPASGSAHYNRGASYWRKGERGLARRDTEEACRLGYQTACGVPGSSPAPR